MSDRYKQVVRAVGDSAWAILPGKLATIMDLIEYRADGHKLTDQEIQARIGAAGKPPAMQVPGNVAVIPIMGVITPRADLFTEMSGGTSIQGFQDQFRAALNDKTVQAIVLDVASPGGQVDMVPEMAAEIRAARGKKPIVAVANTLAASAAYWLGSQADEFVASPSAEVGSIGVFAAHNDISAMQDQMGVKTTLVSAGKFKTENSPFAPLSEDAKAAIQSRVDDSYAMFTADVAKGRRVSVDTVRSGFGEGRVVTAKQALSEGMIDRIDTLEATVQRVSRTAASSGGRGAGISVEDARRAFGAKPAEPAEFVTNPDGTIYVSWTGPPGTTSTNNTNTAATSGLFYAPIGATLAEEGASIGAAALDYIDRVSSLGEARRGALSGAKRDALTAFAGSLRDALEQTDGLLDATDPDKERAALIAAHARYLRHDAA